MNLCDTVGRAQRDNRCGYDAAPVGGGRRCRPRRSGGRDVENSSTSLNYARIVDPLGADFDRNIYVTSEGRRGVQYETEVNLGAGPAETHPLSV